MKTGIMLRDCKPYIYKGDRVTVEDIGSSEGMVKIHCGHESAYALLRNIALEEDLPEGVQLVAVLNGRIKGVIHAGKGDSKQSARFLIHTFVKDVTIKENSGTREDRQEAANVFRGAGWEQWTIDPAIWVRPQSI